MFQYDVNHDKEMYEKISRKYAKISEVTGKVVCG